MWMYTDLKDEAGHKGIRLDQDGGGSNTLNYTGVYSVTMNNETGNQLIATLNLSREFVQGYYWCIIDEEVQEGVFQNPTQVMQINNTCYPGVSCSSSTIQTTHGRIRCATGERKENITIVNVQDTSACVNVIPPTVTTDDGKGMQ